LLPTAEYGKDQREIALWQVPWPFDDPPFNRMSAHAAWSPLEPARERSRGRLHIYFGAAPGVGKTYTMLSDARVRRARGADVVIGLVETHGFADTEALRQGFESLLPKKIVRHDRTSDELDIDAALARRPGLVLIDDLAHRNPEGARHLQRWQDIEEIIEHGIDVCTTMNVQDLESLKETVHEFTKMRFPQTVPDSVFEQADDITLVDLPANQLLERVREGKAFLAQSEHNPADVFQEEAVASLRELALQRTVDHLERRRLARNRGQGNDGRWQVRKKVLVCIGPEPVAEKLIRAGKRLASFLQAEWLVAYGETVRAQHLPDQERERVIEYLNLAQELGAETLTLSGYAMDRRIIELARRKNVGRVVLERPAGSVWQRWRRSSTIRALGRAAPDLDVFLIAAEHSSLAQETSGTYARPPPSASTRAAVGTRQWEAYLWSVGITAGATLVSTAVFRHPEPTNHFIVYLLGVLFVASRFGFWPSAIAAILSVLASDYLLIPPYFSFAVARPQDVVTLGVFLLAALAASRLTANLRLQSESAKQREQRVRFLYEFTRALAGARTVEGVASIAVRHISNELQWQCSLLPVNSKGQVTLGDTLVDGAKQAFDLHVAQWVFDNRQPAGWGTGTMGERRDLYLPISGSAQRFGVLALRPSTLRVVLLPEQRRLIDTVSSQVSQTMERIHLARQAHTATVLAETETLRNSLLSAIAHDFRTPLASIVAASSTLLQGKGRLSEGQARELTLTIFEEGQRMAKLANNTLEMARLEAGAVRLHREWYPLDEIVGAVISRMEDRLEDHVVETRLPAGVPMAQVDVVMIVQVLENLIDNAIKYTPAGTRIEVGAEEQPGQIRFWVSDEGPGLADGEERKIFEKFYRGPGQDAQSGVGLGLTICRIIVEAHGGQILARNRATGGAEFSFTVPSTEAPPQFHPEE